MSDTSLLVVKIVFIIGIFLLAMVAGNLPARTRRCRESPTFLGIANSFSGGVFLAIAFIHILPEAVRDYGIEEGKFPLPFLLVFVGYAFILTIDKVLFDTHAAFGHDDEYDDDHKHADPAEAKFVKET